MKILYPKVNGQGHQRGQDHSKIKKCGKYNETCGELKISFSKFPYEFDIFGGLNHFWQQQSTGAVGPVCVCVRVCVSSNSSETNSRINFIFGTNVKHTPGIVQIFFGDLRSKVKVTSEVKVIPKIKSAGNLMKRVEN